MAIFLSILIFSFSASGIALYYFLGNFVISEKVELLKQSSTNINNFFGIYMENQDNPLAEYAFESILETYYQNTNSFIWIINKEGSIIYAKPSLPPQLLALLADENGTSRLAVGGPYDEVLRGEKAYIQIIGDFHGFFKNEIFSDLGDSWLTIEKPLIYDNQVQGAVYLHTPTPEIQKARSSVFRYFILSVVVSVIFSIIPIYLFSRRLSNPLKQISMAAKIIAGGDFREKVSIESRDEIGQLAKSFNQMTVGLQNQENMRRGFVANVSHELRTPMTSIRGFIEGILDGTIPPERHKDYLLIVSEEVNRLSRLVTDLLDLARMEAGEIPLTMKRINVNELVRRSVIRLETMIVEKKIRIEADFGEEELFAYADSDGIERVLINLLHNAVKFTHEGGRITISTRRQKDKILTTVADDGKGIPPDEIGFIWDRFYKADKSRSMDKTGTGLGLAIIKNIINEHKQEIWVESTTGEGSKFTFTLERARE